VSISTAHAAASLATAAHAAAAEATSVAAWQCD